MEELQLIEVEVKKLDSILGKLTALSELPGELDVGDVLRIIHVLTTYTGNINARKAALESEARGKIS